MNRQHISLFKAVWVLMLLFTAAMAQGQVLRTSFFMEGTQYRLQVNPALPPERGYVHLPAVSNTGAWEYSNTLSASDFFDMVQNIDDVDYYTTDNFYAKLKDRNRASAGAATDLIAAGWWNSKGFVSVNVGLKVNGNVSAPHEMFSFMRDMRGMNSNDYTNYKCNMRDIEVDVNSYIELGVGYARYINDRLSVGGRVKGLLGLGNAEFRARNVTVTTNLEGLDPNLNWSTASPIELSQAVGTASVVADARLQSSFEGLELVTNEDGYIETLKLRAGKMGVSGLGAAIDAGVAYEVADGVTLSASVNDLGFIRWLNGCSNDAYANTDALAFDSSNPGDVTRFFGIIGSDEPINLHLLRLTPTGEKRGRTTSIAGTFTVGGQYRTTDQRIGFGALYSCHTAKPGALSEFTLGFDFRPIEMMDFAVTYSPILCGGQSFGLALKMGPLFVGTDYMYLGNNAKACNALVGLSIPLSVPD